jgi:hypothetical protein
VRHVGLIGVLIGILVTSVAATAAIRVSVTPVEGTPRTKFTVSFVVDRKVTGDRWLTVRVNSPVSRNDCENVESRDVTYAPKGRRVNVLLRPLDKGRWCPGVYGGDIHVEYLTPCGGAGLDEGYCSRNGATVGRFSFSVAP